MPFVGMADALVLEGKWLERYNELKEAAQQDFLRAAPTPGEHIEFVTRNNVRQHGRLIRLEADRFVVDINGKELTYRQNFLSPESLAEFFAGPYAEAKAKAKVDAEMAEERRIQAEAEAAAAREKEERAVAEEKKARQAESEGETDDATPEYVEQAQAGVGIRALFAKANAAEEDGNVNFFGFYTGMPKDDLLVLLDYYGLLGKKELGYAENPETHEIYMMQIKLRGIRRITKGGNSFDELVQAVANRVGTMKHKGGWDENNPGWFEYKTIDGVTVKMDEKDGCFIHDAPRAEEAKRAQEREQAKTFMLVERLRPQIPDINRTIRSGESRKPGEVKTITLPGGATMKMVWCPPGVFLMGNPLEESSLEELEESSLIEGEFQHPVRLTKGFWMAMTEVTQRQWQSVMDDNPADHKGNNLPVEKVCWYDCLEFCKRTGLRLPTEAEWEYACRAGTTGPYGGTGKLEDMGWYDKNSDIKTHPVGQKQPNAWGLYDMHGNVLEWCADWFGFYPNGEVTDPTGPESGVGNVTRGGCFGLSASECRSAYRGGMFSIGLHNFIGFRPVAWPD